jgi:hypothetical protein
MTDFLFEIRTARSSAIVEDEQSIAVDAAMLMINSLDTCASALALSRSGTIRRSCKDRCSTDSSLPQVVTSATEPL